MTTHSNSNRTPKRGKSPEEQHVESTLLVAMFLTLIPFFVLLIGLFPLVASRGFLQAISLMLGALFGSHAIISLLMGARFHFSTPQFRLTAKYILMVDVAFPIALIAYMYPFMILLLNAPPTDFLLSTIRITLLVPILLLFLTIYLIRRTLGKHFGDWLTIKGASKPSLDDATKLFLKGQRELTRRNFEGAAESFSFAAWAYVDQQKWSDAGENFQRAAEAYSNDKNLQFGSACHYCFALACFIIDGDSEHADNTMQKVNQVLHSENIDSKGKEIVSKLLTFLELIQKGESEKAQNTWKTLKKKIPEWMYAFPDQAQNLLEKCLEQAQKKP